MRSFKNFFNEKIEPAYGIRPKAGDEQDFMDKHVVDVIDHPLNDKETLNGTKKSPGKKKRRADNDQEDAEGMYEEKDDDDEDEDLDPVDKKAVKKKFKDREDKDLDNDGDTDDSDEYLHKRRKAVSKAIDKVKEEIELDEFKNDGKEKYKETMMVVDPKDPHAKKGGGVKRINASDWPAYKKKGYVQAESFDMDEEIELDEISDKSKLQYVAKASKDIRTQQGRKGALSGRTWSYNRRNNWPDDEEDAAARKQMKNYDRKIKNRKAGIERATKEEVELDEGYEKVVTNILKDHGISSNFYDGTVYVDKGDVNKAKQILTKAVRSGSEINKAPKVGDKAKMYEEVDLDEVSQSTQYRRDNPKTRYRLTMRDGSTKVVTSDSAASAKDVGGYNVSKVEKIKENFENDEVSFNEIHELAKQMRF